MDCYNWLSYVLLHNCDISIDSYSPVNKFYSFIIFSLLNCLVLILNLYMQFLSLRCYFLHLNLIWTLTLLWKYPNLCTVSLLLYLMVLKTISLGSGVRASLMLFWNNLIWEKIDHHFAINGKYDRPSVDQFHYNSVIYIIMFSATPLL